jgi:peptidoglycan hydrolase CwlO-like protein
MVNKKHILITILLVFIGNFFIVQIPVVHSQTVTPTPTPDTSAKAGDLQGQISEYQKKISDAQAQANTLSSQLKVMDNQITLTELRISSNKEQSRELTEDITTATNKIGRLEGSLEKITKVLLKRIVTTYQVGQVSELNILLSSTKASDLVTRSNYLKIVQAHDKKLIYDTQQAKNDYQNQKSILESKKTKVDALQKQLESYTTQLAEQKKGRH